MNPYFVFISYQTGGTVKRRDIIHFPPTLKSDIPPFSCFSQRVPSQLIQHGVYVPIVSGLGSNRLQQPSL